MKNNSIMRAVGLTKQYNQHDVVSELNIDIHEGDIYGVLGPNGAGKTTTLKMILGFIHPTAGDIIKKDGDALKIGAMIDNTSFYEHLTGRKNLEVFAALYGSQANERIDKVLDIVELQEAAYKKVRQYSLGMKQRLGIARSFLNDPDIIILDEPTNGLDPYGMRAIRELIIKLTKKYHKTFIVSTHLLTEAEQMCNRIGIIHNGQLIREMTTEEIKKYKEQGISLEDYFISMTKEGRRYV
jgi:ABC-2 type transport system ATP-binding protein